MSPDVTLCDIGAFSVEQVASRNDVLEDHCVAPRVLRPCRRTVSGSAFSWFRKPSAVDRQVPWRVWRHRRDRRCGRC